MRQAEGRVSCFIQRAAIELDMEFTPRNIISWNHENAHTGKVTVFRRNGYGI